MSTASPGESGDFIAWGTEFECPGCGGEISPRYAAKGVCRDCCGTTDDYAGPYTAEETK